MTSTPFPVEKTWFYFSLLPQILRAYFASKVLPNFTIKIAVSKGSETASVWFQTKLTGAKRLPRGFPANAEARHTPRRPCGLSCGLGVSDPSPQAPPFRAEYRFFPKLKFYSIFFKKLRGRGAEPPPPRARGGTLYPVKRFFRVNCREAARGGFLQVKKPPPYEGYKTDFRNRGYSAFCSLSRSRISVSRTISAGGAAGAFGCSSFFRRNRLSSLTIVNTTSEISRKLTTCCKKLP